MGRPHPPPAPDSTLYLPAPEVVAWARGAVIDAGGSIHNPDHAHLAGAGLLAIWTWEDNSRHMRTVLATAEVPRPLGGGWTKGRHEDLLRRWAGRAPHEALPDFVLTFHAPLAAELDDASWCALVEHELYHCGQARDEFGAPRFHRDSGLPVFALRGHDAEEFVGVVRRYGAGAAAGGVAELVAAAGGRPEVAAARVAGACGTCLRMAA
jgi:hypothetical protein